MATPRVPLAQYLFIRLSQLGITSIHGVPGDYNLTLLDHIDARAGQRWVGNAAELSAGYAADGYARTKGAGALVTCFGVGELSVLNAIAGAYAEKAAVVHVVGTPPRRAREARACLHHTLGDGDHGVFAKMYESVTVAQAVLMDAETAPAMVDAVLRECVRQSCPVYLAVPMDMVAAEVAAPASPIVLSVAGGGDEGVEDKVVGALFAKMLGAERPLILVDGFTARFDIRDEVNELVRVTGYPTLTTPFGKSIVRETLPSFCGVWAGLAGDPAHQRWVEDCDLVLRFGPLDSDVNTFGFTAKPNPDVAVTFERYSVQMPGGEGASAAAAATTTTALSTKSVLQKLLKRLADSSSAPLPAPQPFPENRELPQEQLKNFSPPAPDSPVDQQSFWLRMSAFLRAGDVVLTETGTAFYGGQSLALPDNTRLLNSSIWLSIGYALAATQGVALAQRELANSASSTPGRTILFEGEGSFQLTAEAISDIARNRLDVVIFVLNNNGYAVERIIHGFHAEYNDVQPWRYLNAPAFFGAPLDDPAYPVRTRRAGTWGELEDALGDRRLVEGRGLNVVEVCMGMGDAPASMVKFADYLNKRNKGGL
ncbi:hypothetical protein SLS58_007966 [Diplodia intermedia]|uniref:Pyruvate decarboxylase n=1 Tax=Diplodia intermedia TaxID=856260 RepID=A0ABR3TJ31_9PEZI